MIKNFLLKTVFILLCGFSFSLAYAQCPATGPTIYSILSTGGLASETLQSTNPATGVGTTINTDLIKPNNYYNPVLPSTPGQPTQISALAWDVPNGKLWYASVGGNGAVYIFSYNIATNTVDVTWARFRNTANTGIQNDVSANKAAYNPVDKKIYFHVGPSASGAGSPGLYRLDPANLAAGAVFLGNLTVDGSGNADATLASGGDIAFDGLGNMTGAFNSANKLVVYKAQYDANGNYLGISMSGQSFASFSISAVSSVAFLADGNYLVGGPSQAGTLNSNTGVFTNIPGATGTVDYASCQSPSPEITVQKTGSRNCANRSLSYTISVSNSSNNAHAYDTVLKDATPSGLTLASGTLNGTTLTATELALLGGTGLPLKSPPATGVTPTNGVLLKGTTATVVLNYTYAAASDANSFSNQGFVKYTGVEVLNLPNDQIPSDDPNTAATGDPTVVVGCGVITGTVFTDNNGITNGPDGTPTSGVTITLFAADGVTQLATTTTDTNGDYRFTNVNIVPGNYVVVITPPTGFENVSSTDSTPTDGKTNVTIPASGAGVGGVNFGIAQPPTFCYKPAVTTGTILDTQHGISSLGRAGVNNSNWPMVRKGAWTVLEAKTKGFVPNRLTTVQKNALTPVEGMMVYDTDLDCLSIYNGTAWNCFKTQACPD